MAQLLLACVAILAWGLQGSAREIEVDLSAPWPSTALSPVLEISEFMAEESNADFWKFIETLRGGAEEDMLGSLEEEDYSQAKHMQISSFAVSQAATQLTPLQLAALRLTLSVRSFAPLVDAHRTLATASAHHCTQKNDSFVAAWAVLVPSNRVLCSPAELGEALNSSSDWRLDRLYEESLMADLDHPSQLVSTRCESGETAVLYGRIGSTRFWNLLDALTASVRDGNLKTFVFRHGVPLAKATTHTALQGYGVNLDIKNMEYKNLDDGAGQFKDDLDEPFDDDDEEEITFDEDEEVQGVMFHTILERRPDLSKKLKSLHTSLLQDSDGATDDLKVWKMKDLGLQAVASIMTSKDPLHRLLHVSQDFPMHASALSMLKVPSSLRREVVANQKSTVLRSGQLGGGSSTLYVNGRAVDIGLNTFNLFNLIQTIRSETRILQRLSSLGLPSATSNALLDLEAPSDGANQQQQLRVDMIEGSKGVMQFINNLEKDAMYKRWPKSLKQLLYPSWQLQTLSRNLYTLVLVVDPSTKQGLEAINVIFNLYQHMYPVRFGFIMTSKEAVQQMMMMNGGGDQTCTLNEGKLDLTNIQRTADAADVVSLFAEAKAKHTISVAFEFLRSLSESLQAPFTVNELIQIYANSVSTAKGSWTKGSYETEAKTAIERQSSPMLLSKDDDGDENVGYALMWNMTKYVADKGIPVNKYMMNGIVSEGLDFQSGLMQTIGMEQHHIQSMLQDGRLPLDRKGVKSKSVLSTILTDAKALPRFHPLLKERAEDMKFIIFPQKTLTQLPFIHPSATATAAAVTVTVVGDMTKPSALKQFQEAIKALRIATSSSSSKPKSEQKESVYGQRLSFIHTGDMRARIPALLYSTVETHCSNADHPCLDRVEQVLMTSLSALEGEPVDEDESMDDDDAVKAWQERLGAIWASVSKDLPLGVASTGAVIMNGRVISLSSPLNHLDITLFSSMEYQQRASKVATLVREENAMVIASGFLGQYTQTQRENLNLALEGLSTKHTMAEFGSFTTSGGDSAVDVSVRVTAVLDPLTEAAQRVAPLLLVLRDQLKVPLRVVLLPQMEVTEFPLQKFYRFVVNSDVEEVSPVAEFRGLPKGQILTMRMDVPEAWNVQSSFAVQDVDNLRCDDVTCGDEPGSSLTHIQYTLKSLVLGGQCYDTVERRPPNGLELRLVKPSDQPISDTLVMQNLGYFQLQAQPGVWNLELAPGRGRDLYETMALKDGSAREDRKVGNLEEDQLTVVTHQRVLVSSFYDQVTQLRVRKRVGMEAEKLLDEIPQGDVDVDDGDGSQQEPTQGSDSLLSSISSMFGVKTANANASLAQNEKIHVFSLATGHLYERFLKIMMLSVVKRASMPVKFWLFENYLSPTFKDSAMAMAEEYGFEVAFVTYKWPSWLRQQTSKQRIIWGYKILFLDVLFPLNVNKVIYVDSDQTVRGDLAELWKMDLKGRPYGYTPFCSSRKETLGYQFWRQGYWKDHLRGKPYHISALYVVDLNAFRRMAVGDQLRALYDNLSRDPNSLSNLDQDLPNYAQHMIPIFSLPQEWLWCESWCSDASKAKAKTIDLCNNPMHKEPKLDMAKRVVSGKLFQESWTELDDEIRSLEKRHHISAGSSEATAASFAVGG